MGPAMAIFLEAEEFPAGGGQFPIGCHEDGLAVLHDRGPLSPAKAMDRSQCIKVMAHRRISRVVHVAREDLLEASLVNPEIHCVDRRCALRRGWSAVNASRSWRIVVSRA